jgi:hypothetical protein
MLLHLGIGVQPLGAFFGDVEQWFSTFMAPRPSKFFSYKTRPSPNKFTRKYLSGFVKAHALS